MKIFFLFRDEQLLTFLFLIIDEDIIDECLGYRPMKILFNF